MNIRRVFRVILLAALVLEWILSLWLARPWNGQEPYDSFAGFGMLVGILVLQAVPPIILLGLGTRLMRSAPTSWIYMIGSSLLMVGGVVIMGEATFVTVDAQSGIAMVITPFFQLFLTIVLLVVTWAVGRLTR